MGAALRWETPVPVLQLLRAEAELAGPVSGSESQIVIEGFPRSGNTFAVVAFEQAQRESVRVAHHLHMPAQVIRAVQWSIPILLLARKPTDAALSWIIRGPGVPIRQTLKHYVSFYEKAAEYRHSLVMGSSRR